MVDSLDPASFDGPLVGGRYKLGPVLGPGGQAAMHRAWDQQAQRMVAVKAFALNQVKDWKELDLFRRECRVLKELNHPGIPRFLDEINSPDGTTGYLVMELVPGQSLKDHVRRGGVLKEAELWRVLWETVDILAYLHARQPPIVHRDVKPSNLIRQPDGTISLVDFGVVQDDPKLKGGGNTFVGTFGFMAPEQLHGEALPATDVYSLGATLIALGTGEDPEDLPHEGLRIRFEDQLRVSDELKDVLRQLTEPDPLKRPASAVVLKQDLQARTQRDRSSSTTAHEDPAPAESTDADVPAAALLPADVPPPVGLVMGVVLTILGTLGTLALTVIDVALIPIIFTLAALATPLEKRGRLAQKQQMAHQVLGVGRKAFQQLTSTGWHEARRQQQRLEQADKKDKRLGGKKEQKRLEEDARRKAAQRANESKRPMIR